MKLKTNTKQIRGFTLIEMIGVLAVIAILAALLIPKVFNAINDSKINTAVVGAATVKAAIVEHYGKYGQFDSLNNLAFAKFTTPPTFPYKEYDTEILMKEGLLENPFNPKVGDSADVVISQCADDTVEVAGANELAYDLDGTGDKKNDVTGQYILEAVINNVAAADAHEISLRIDGKELSETDSKTADLEGRVKYIEPVKGVTSVYIYLTHR